MLQKIINYIKPSQPIEELQEVTKRQQKIQDMKKLVNMNEYFQCPDHVIADAEILINWFCDDKIDVFIPDQQESILYISGFVQLLLKNRPFKIVVHFQFFQGYPYQICNISIENKSLKEKDVKINSFYQKSLSSDLILLNQYLVQAQTWLNHKEIKPLLEEAILLLTKNFPYIKLKSEMPLFHQQQAAVESKAQIENENQQKNNVCSEATIEQQNILPQEEQRSVNIIQAPIIPKSKQIYGPSGLLLEEENQLQQQITRFTIATLKQHRNDIVGMKNYFSEMKIYKQQQNGLRLQLIWLRQQLDNDLEQASSHYGKLQAQLEQNSKEEVNNQIDAVEFDPLSNQIVDLIADYQASKDIYLYICKRFRQGKIDYTTLISVSEQYYFLVYLNCCRTIILLKTVIEQNIINLYIQ